VIPLERRRHFLAVVTKEEAEKRWRDVIQPAPLGSESVPLEQALGRVLSEDVRARIDLPPFDRSVVDGFALVAKDTFGADEEKRARLALTAEALAAGSSGQGVEVKPGAAVEIATGAPVPRGANAVVMVERCERAPGAVLVGAAVVPGEGIQFAGSDVRRGEVIFRRGERLGARETGVLAAQGFAGVSCWRRPRVAVLSTGDELVVPGGEIRGGQIYESNGRIVCDLLRENGCEPVPLGIARDSRDDLRAQFARAMEADAFVLSGGTSKGAGDLTYQLVNEFGKPGILVHGVAVKPGKPLVLAAWGRKPIAVLPGFPSSAAITFDVFVKPVLRVLAGLEEVERRDRREARLAVSMPAGGGRHEFVLVNLVAGDDGLVAFPLLKGSGSVAAFAQADGYLEVASSRERAERGDRFEVTMLAGRAADLVVAGAVDPLVDRLLERLAGRGVRAKVLATGSLAGLDAVARGEADVAATVLRDEAVKRKLALVLLGKRRQGIVARDMGPLGDAPSVEKARALGWRLINRNPGSGTRALIDRLLGKDASQVPGYSVLARSPQGAVAAVAAGTADFTIAPESVAREAGLQFFPLVEEEIELAFLEERRARLVTLLEVV
jgi:putative molybdopterin biosynthesis protein